MEAEAALEHLRAGDRILRGVVARARQTRQYGGARKGASMNAADAADDVESIEGELIVGWREAADGFVGLGRPAPAQPETPEWQPGLWGRIKSLWQDATWVTRARQAEVQAEHLRTQIRVLFDEVRLSDPVLLDRVAPLETNIRVG